ncbi:c6 transcription factor [Ophiostoma piceae UAMH 11346]|uniref:C6 transcription factor n=1 Tax=Ophiostoma piceae (strain UAMH 11346) TaxID=1262450 RepID=S3CF77_OPHP1|nr:c6 transcription factor [Ophiostoma piceae UAMH 11346]
MNGKSVGGTAAPASEPAGRQRTATLRRSCETCRNVKARCIVEPTEDTSKARCCKRIECVFENALARPKKLKYSARTRVKDVEEKLDGLIALISARKDAAAGTPPASSGAAANPPASAIEAAARSQDSFNMTADTFGMPNTSFPSPIGINYDFSAMPELSGAPAALATASTGNHALTVPGGDVIDRGLIKEEAASHLLAQFTLSSEKQFPFVPMPSYTTLGYMRRERPHALLAILTVASDTAQQIRLALEYRKALAQAMIVESKNSLDLLQSILIFCIWHHQYFKPYSSQLYQLSQIAVNMAVEINLPNSTPPALLGVMVPTQQTLNQRARTNRTPTEQMTNEIERARTFLGIYCLSASIATAHRKPTHFKYDRRMDQACQFLANAQDRSSDLFLLPYHVQIRKLAEDVDRVFGNLDQGGISLDASYIETMVKDFERQYEQLRLAIPAQSWSNAALRCAMMYLPVVIYEVALRMPPEHKELLSVSPHANCCNWCGSSTRLALIMKCISAAQGYINCYVDLPPDEARRVTIIEVSRHIDAILVLTRAALGFDTKNFEQSNLAPGRASLLVAADVARYLAASERKMTAMVAMTENECGGSTQEEKHDLFWQLKHIFEFSLNWYNKRVHTQPGGRPKTMVEINSYELAKLDVSPIVWIGQGTSMAKGQCGQTRAADMQNATPDCVMEMAAETASGTGRLPGRVAEDVDKLLHSLGVCVVPETMPQGMRNGDNLDLDSHISLPSIASVDSMTISDSSSSAPMVTPESDGSGFDAGDLDPSFGAIPTWAMDQSAELFANIPQSNMAPPWFSF